MPVKELCRKHGFSDAAFYGWRAKFGGMQVNEAQAAARARGREREAEEALGGGAPGCRGAEGRLRGKTLAPQAKRQAVMKMRQGLRISERRACGLVGLARTTLRACGGRSPGYSIAQGSDHRSGACSATIRISTHPRSAAPGRQCGRTTRRSIGYIGRQNSACTQAPAQEGRDGRPPGAIRSHRSQCTGASIS